MKIPTVKILQAAALSGLILLCARPVLAQNGDAAAAPAPMPAPVQMPAQMPATAEKELPKALYIVPWKDADMGAPLPPPQVSVENSALAPLDRDEFRLRLRYQSGATGAVSGGK